MRIITLAILLVFNSGMYAQVSKTWVADQGNGTYKNPVLHADYSDPDAIRVGDDYYMTASSFEDVPGLPILHSKDLVNWKLIGHALNKLVPEQHFSAARHGEGVWAPSIRYHKNEFYIYYPDPDFGIYLVKAKHPAGPWSDPILVEGGKGLIDPCPLWDEDGKVYLVHAFAGSRAGFKSILVVKQMNAEGTKTIDDGVIVYDGHEMDPTVEGPKFYKRYGHYYIFAPAGGVSTGWQLVLRSKNIYGPYERRNVMDQGATGVNGPHQGAWVSTAGGEDWFLHFQDKEAYGRIVHLQPMKWINGWPVIGEDKDGDGKGEPVMQYKKPNAGKVYPISTPPESDEFNESKLGLQWQWMGNPQPAWAMPFPATGVLQMFSVLMPDSAKNLWQLPNVLQQKWPAENFVMTTKLDFFPNTKIENERAGLAVMGLDYAGLAVKSTKNGNQLVYLECKQADKNGKETELVITEMKTPTIWLRVEVKEGGKCSFSYSIDGNTFINAGSNFTARPGRWKGAKAGIFCTRTTVTNDAGFAAFDYFRVIKN